MLSWLNAQEKSGSFCLQMFSFWGAPSASLAPPEEEVVVAVGLVRDEIALPAGMRMCWVGCGVVAAATAVPGLPSGKIWPSPARGACTSGTTTRRGERAGMVLFVIIPVVSAMVVRVSWWVSSPERCRVM